MGNQCFEGPADQNVKRVRSTGTLVCKARRAFVIKANERGSCEVAFPNFQNFSPQPAWESTRVQQYDVLTEKPAAVARLVPRLFRTKGAPKRQNLADD